jgi:ATPase subunit of ABC transporter with duplicated ATPase domains
MSAHGAQRRAGIVVNDLAFAHPGGQALFFGVSFRVRAGETTGLVGENGVGKTTLLRILAGELAPAEGSFQITADLLYLPQWAGLERHGETVQSFLASIAPHHLRRAASRLLAAEAADQHQSNTETRMALAEAISEWSEIGGYEEEARWDQITRHVLGQGLADVGGRPMQDVSGGEAKRIALELMLKSDAPVLLLDEPDNSLDVPGKIWLESELRKSKKCVLLVSHDRTLLATCASRIVTMETAGAWVHGESYITYPEAREKRIAELGENLERWKEEERRLFRLYKWMKTRASISDKNAPYADAAETRWRRFVEAGPPPPPPKRQKVAMHLNADRSGRRVVECRDLELPGLVLPFDLDVTAGEKIALLGSNGVGKSHILRLLAGEPLEYSGSFRIGASVRVGYFSQHGMEAATAGRSTLEQLLDVMPNPESARRLLAQYGLQDRWQEDVAHLSGGQRARLQIALLEAKGTNLLLLDEPTDNLDLGSAEALELTLAEFTGTVLAVTHDRTFMANLDRFLILDSDGEVLEPSDLGAALRIVTSPGSDRPTNVRSLTTL